MPSWLQVLLSILAHGFAGYFGQQQVAKSNSAQSPAAPVAPAPANPVQPIK